jgi:hypothetical protein
LSPLIITANGFLKNVVMYLDFFIELLIFNLRQQ